MELKEPRKKRLNRGQLAEAHPYLPLPVLIEDVSGISACKSLWPMFVGTFNGDSVIISNEDEISSLYNMGFFGKGCYSRGFPCFGKNKQGIPPILQERQWKRRQTWMDQLASFATDQNPNKCNDADRPSDKNKDHTRNESKRKTSEQDIVSMDFDEIEISDEDIEKSKDIDDVNRSIKSKMGALSSKDVELSNDIQPQEISIDSSPKLVEIVDDSSADSKSEKEKETSASSPAVDKQSTTANSIIVINDMAFDDYETQMKSLQPRLCNEPIKTVLETLNLSLEEAFFLSYALGCLQVVNLQGIFMTLTEMWQTYKDLKPRFMSSYIAYHHFRSKGWVVKSGLKYGGDFLLYKKGPLFHHASYIVLVEDACRSSSSVVPNRTMSWTKLLGLQRMAEAVSKDVLICYVQWPPENTPTMFDSPEVVSKFKVQEVLYRRWNSHKKDVKDNN